MADKKQNFKLPAVGKKPSSKKPLSNNLARNLGSAANEQYKAGASSTATPTFGPKKGQTIKERDFGRYRKQFGSGNNPAKYDSTYTGPGKKPKRGPSSYYNTRKQMARQTGV